MDGKTEAAASVPGDERQLIVMADDFGIGPATSEAILDLARRGVVTGTVLLVNSPYAEPAVQAWWRSGKPMELGWHPCLTLDKPLTPPEQVRSLIRKDGTFYPLNQFMRRLFLGLLRPQEIETELRAQAARFREMVGEWPRFMNGHHHVHVFAPVADALARLLAEHRPLTYVRRVHESWRMLIQIPGARLKRLFLSSVGDRTRDRFDRAGFPGNEVLAGVTDPVCVTDPQYLSRWLMRVPGRVVELACHPGYLDTTLIGRDCTEHDGCLQRRVDEMLLFSAPNFAALCQQAGFRLVPPSRLLKDDAAVISRAA